MHFYLSLIAALKLTPKMVLVDYYKQHFIPVVHQAIFIYIFGQTDHPLKTQLLI